MGINKRIKHFFPLFFFIFSIASCELFFPPQFYDQMVNKQTNQNNPGNSSGSNPGGISANPVTTLYITGEDHNQHACLWIVGISNNTVSTNVLNTTANSDAAGAFLSGGQLYIAGSDGPYTSTHNLVYWTILTNGGTGTPHIIQNGSYIAANDVYVDNNNVVWAVGDGNPGGGACYWTNSVQVDMNGGAGSENVGGFTVVGNAVYASFHSGMLGTDRGFSYINGTLSTLSNSVINNATGYTGGIVVTNGVIYIAQNDGSLAQSYVWISSNSGVSFSVITLNGTIPDGGVFAGVCYNSGFLYVGGKNGTAPCYWKIDTASGSVNQVTPNASGNGIINDLSVRNGVVYSIGMDGANACYWIGSTEYTLDANAIQIQGIELNP